MLKPVQASSPTFRDIIEGLEDANPRQHPRMSKRPYLCGTLPKNNVIALG